MHKPALFFGLAFNIAVFSIAPNYLPAQTPATPPPAPARPAHLLFEDTIIRSGSAAQFEPAHHDYCVAVVKGGAPACLVFSTATFGESNRYFTLLPFASFLHYDQGKYTDKGLTPDEAKALAARRNPPVVSNHEAALILLRDLSFFANNEAKPLNMFFEYRVRPGSMDAFMKSIRELIAPAAKKSGLPSFEVFQTATGASPDLILLVYRLDNFAQLDNPDPVIAQLTPAQAETWKHTLATTVDHVDSFIMRYRPDLSVPSAAPPK